MNTRRIGARVPFVSLCILLTGAASGTAGPLARLHGRDFSGGAAHVYGARHFGMTDVSFIYAHPTGPLSVMQASFNSGAKVPPSVCVFVYGRDDDAAAACPIEILLNGVSIFRGASGFPGDGWRWRRFGVPGGTLRPGRNELSIINQASEGTAGMPPWFMVAECRIAEESYDPEGPPMLEEDFRIAVRSERRPLPEPLPVGRPTTGFRIRGTKGWGWLPEQYLAEIPVLARYRMNFLMNCYLSMFDIRRPGDLKAANRWWEPLSEAKKAAYVEVVRACQRNGVEWCFAMNPNLMATRILDYGSRDDLDALWQHYEWMAGLGVKWFSVCLDDISKGIDAAGQARAVNEILRRLRSQSPAAELIFCPTFYWGTGEDPKDRGYLEALARILDRDVYVFWTGPRVVSPTIPRASAEAYKARVRHRLVIWDNYPVNDANPTLHLGPVIGRDADLYEVVDGFMANPLCPQNEINRVPLLTIADYAYNPRAYDPVRSIGQAILHLAETAEQRRALRNLVELYPGMLLTSQGTAWNPVLARFEDILRTSHARPLADAWLHYVEEQAASFARAFPDRFLDARQTLEENLAVMKAAYARKYGPP